MYLYCAPWFTTHAITNAGLCEPKLRYLAGFTSRFAQVYALSVD